MKRETFAEFLSRNIQYQPVSGEEMVNVYRKQHDAFIAYVDEQVTGRLNEIDAAFERNNITTA